MVAVYISNTLLKLTYFGVFKHRSMKFNFYAWHRCGTKIVQFRFNNFPSKYSSTSPCLVSPEGAIYILALTYFSERLSLTIVRGSDRPVLARRQPFTPVIGRMSQTTHSSDLVMAWLRFRGFGFLFKLVISLLC